MTTWVAFGFQDAETMKRIVDERQSVGTEVLVFGSDKPCVSREDKTLGLTNYRLAKAILAAATGNQMEPDVVKQAGEIVASVKDIKSVFGVDR